MQWNNKEEKRFKAKVVEAYEKEGSSYYSTARLWDDGIIDPADTRKIIGLCISASLNCPAEDTRYGVFIPPEFFFFDYQFIPPDYLNTKAYKISK